VTQKKEYPNKRPHIKQKLSNPHDIYWHTQTASAWFPQKILAFQPICQESYAHSTKHAPNGLHAVAGKLELAAQRADPPDEVLQTPLHSQKCTAWVVISKHGIIWPYWFEDEHERAETVNTKRYLAVMRKVWAALFCQLRRGSHLVHVLQNEHNFTERQARTLKLSVGSMQRPLVCVHKFHEDCPPFAQFMALRSGTPFLWVTLMKLGEAIILWARRLYPFIMTVHQNSVIVRSIVHELAHAI